MGSCLKWASEKEDKVGWNVTILWYGTRGCNISHISPILGLRLVGEYHMKYVVNFFKMTNYFEMYPRPITHCIVAPHLIPFGLLIKSPPPPCIFYCFLDITSSLLKEFGSENFLYYVHSSFFRLD